MHHLIEIPELCMNRYLIHLMPKWGFPGGAVVKNPLANAGDLGLIPGSGRSPWRREWLPTPVFLPEESHAQRSLVGYSPWGHKELDVTERLNHHHHTRQVATDLLLLEELCCEE